MTHHQLVIASRDGAETAIIRSAIGQSSIPAYHKVGALLEYLVGAPDSFLVMTTLLLDETATGLLARCAVIAPFYSVLYARHCDRAINLLQIYGAGCARVLGPEETDQLPAAIAPSEDMLASFVIPPFFVDDDEPAIREPSSANARPMHITFIGAQALMSFCNAVQHVPATGAMSMSVVRPTGTWAFDHLMQSIASYSCWSVNEKPMISGGSVTVCNDFESLASLEPTSLHFVICHGELSEAETQYLERLPKEARVYTANDDGYVPRSDAGLDNSISPHKLWKLLVSSLYGD